MSVRWGVAYYRAADGSIPADDFLDRCPTKVEATILAVLEAVRSAPPPAFSGGGKWEAMHGSMAGYYEIRVTGPGRKHYRLFCLLENGIDQELKARGFSQPQIAVINGLVKPNATLFTEAEYRRAIRVHGTRYLKLQPRPVA